MSKRRQSRIAVPFHPNRTGETVDANARRHLRVLNRRLSTHRVSGGETEIVRHVRENARFSQPRKRQLPFLGWFLNEKSGFPFRTPAFCSVSRGQRRLAEKEYRAPSVTPGVALRPRTQAPARLAA